jgi:hypothetical protein
MRIKSKLAVAGLVPMATAFVLASAGTAAADGLYDTTANALLPTGTVLAGTGVQPSVVNTSNGLGISCANTSTRESVTRNVGPGAAPVVSALSAFAFSGSAANGDCPKNIAGMSVPTTVSTDISSSTPATVTSAFGSPSTVNITKAGGITLRLQLNGAFGGTVCTYNAPSVAGTRTGTTVAITNAPFSITSANSNICGTGATLTSTVNVSAAGAPTDLRD